MLLVKAWGLIQLPARSPEVGVATAAPATPTEGMGEGSLALWPMIKPDGHAAGVKREELGVMTSGSMWISLFLFD